MTAGSSSDGGPAHTGGTCRGGRGPRRRFGNVVKEGHAFILALAVKSSRRARPEADHRHAAGMETGSEHSVWPGTPCRSLGAIASVSGARGGSNAPADAPNTAVRQTRSPSPLSRAAARRIRLTLHHCARRVRFRNAPRNPGADRFSERGSVHAKAHHTSSHPPDGVPGPRRVRNKHRHGTRNLLAAALQRHAKPGEDVHGCRT